MSNRLPVMLLDRLLKRLIREGELVTTWPDGSTTRYGSPTPGRASVAITIASPTAARRIATNPMLAAGEEFMSGGLRVPDDDILPLLDLVSRSEEHTSELQSLMRISYAVFCLKKK